jgi:hypothetical protein
VTVRVTQKCCQKSTTLTEKDIKISLISGDCLNFEPRRVIVLITRPPPGLARRLERREQEHRQQEVCQVIHLHAFVFST